MEKGGLKLLMLQFNKKSFRKTDNVVVKKVPTLNETYCLLLGLEHDIAFDLNLPYPEQPLKNSYWRGNR